MSFIKSVLSFTVAFMISLILATVAIVYFFHPSCRLSPEKLDNQPMERSAHELYAEFMELSPVERMGKRELLSKAAHGGYLPAIRQMATETRERGLPKDIVGDGLVGNEYDFWIRKAADMGDPEAQHEAFLECDLSDAEKLSYLSRAAEQNYGPALLSLGSLYAEGGETYGIARNERKALECYRRAAKTNERDALYLMYLLARLNVLPEAETAQLNERYKKEAKQAEDEISPSFVYPENLEENAYALQLLTTYLPANEKVKAFREQERNNDPFK